MRGYIVSIEAHDVDNRHVLDIFGRLEDGRSFVTRRPFTPYLYISSSVAPVAQKVLDGIEADFSDEGSTDFSGNAMTKVSVKSKSDFAETIKILRESDVVMHEQDLRADLRFLIDNDIFTTIDIDGKEEQDEFCDVRFIDSIIMAEQMTPQEAIKTFALHVLSVDIETDRKASKILSVALHDKRNGVDEVIVVHEGPLKHALCVKDEYALLEQFFVRVKELDPDVLVGWNFVDFDLAVIRKRAQALGIPFVLGRSSAESRLRIENSFFRDSKAHLFGRQVMDGIWLLKSSFVELDDYKLDTAAKTLLGDEKLKAGGVAVAPNIEEHLVTDPQLVVDYNLMDTQLVVNIFDKTEVFSLAMARSCTTGLYLSEVSLSIKSLDSLYIRELVKLKRVSPPNAMGIREYSVMGGYVKDPEAGLYDNVAVLDFKSLYPSVMRTFNIDPLSFRDEKDYGLSEEEAKAKHIILAPNGAQFVKKRGPLPSIIERVWTQRDIAKHNGDKVASYAFKILMNSLWGAIASSSSRFFSLEMANAITGFCQKMIKLVAAHIEERYGLEVVYGDTDSVFVLLGDGDAGALKRRARDIASEINTFVSGYIAQHYDVESVLELEFEKLYLKFMIPHMRGSDEGSKKRYAGLVSLDDEETKMDFVGLEYVRSDATALVKDFQYHLLHKMFTGGDTDAYVKGFVADLRCGKFDDKLVYRKSLRKPLNEYTKTTPPHVKAARKLPDGPKSRVIRYVMTVDGPEPIEALRSSVDYEHYVDKQIKPVAQSVLSVVGKDVDDVLADKKQSSLFDF